MVGWQHSSEHTKHMFCNPCIASFCARHRLHRFVYEVVGVLLLDMLCEYGILEMVGTAFITSFSVL